jgi:transposase, IS5 family
MGPKPNVPKSDDLFRQRLDEMVNSKHPLVQLTRHIDWSVFEHEWMGFFPSQRGRPAIAPRLVAGLLYLQHTFALSDEEVVGRWVENPYWQLFCGETWFQHHPPIDPSSLTRWRQRIGAEGLQWLLAQTICAAASAKVIRQQSLNKVIVDSTVQEKAIAYPTDSKLLNRGREHLVKLVADAGLTLRQNYNREAPKLAVKIARYAHAKQYKRMRSHLKKLKTLVGRVWRDVSRQLAKVPAHLKPKVADLLHKVERLLKQQPKDSHKLYSLHAPEAECVDLGYRGAATTGIKVYHRKLKRGITARLRRDIRRRSAIEPAIGHMKNDGRLRRNWLKGTQGDAFHALLCGCGHNLRMILRKLRLLLALFLVRLYRQPADDDKANHHLTAAYV